VYSNINIEHQGPKQSARSTSIEQYLLSTQYTPASTYVQIKKKKNRNKHQHEQYPLLKDQNGEHNALQESPIHSSVTTDDYIYKTEEFNVNSSVN
jgi:hypothetical protein